MESWRVEKFWSYVDQSGGEDACWPWTQGIYKQTGYGQATTIASLPGSARSASTTAHRQAWLVTNGPIDTYVHPKSGKTHTHKVLHRCPGGPNRLCCNPAHLAVGSDQDNANDRGRDGNRAHGERMGSAKLTEAQVIEIRRRYANGEPVASLVGEFGVTRGTVTPIVKGRTWRHLL